MNLNVLRYVEAVAEEGGFTKAAERLYVAQPSLSQAIRALEKELGTALFDRSGRTVRVTPAGERYLHWARAVLRSEERLRRSLAAAPDGLRKLNVGASPYRCKALFPKAVSAFCRSYPDCRIEIFDQYQVDALALLDEGKLDLVIDLPPAGGYGTARVAMERVLISVSERLPLPLKSGGAYPTVQLADLLALPVIWIDDAKYASPLHLGPILRRLYEEADAVPDVAVECRGAEMAHILSAQGLGFTVISELFMRASALPGLIYCEIAERPLFREVSAIWRQPQGLSADGQAFLRLLREQAEPDAR